MTPVTNELNYYEGSFVKNIYIKAILFIHIYMCIYNSGYVSCKQAKLSIDTFLWLSICSHTDILPLGQKQNYRRIILGISLDERTYWNKNCITFVSLLRILTSWLERERERQTRLIDLESEDDSERQTDKCIVLQGIMAKHYKRQH